MEVEEKVDANQTAVGTGAWTGGSGRDTSEPRREGTIVFDQSRDGNSASEVTPDDGGTVCDRSHWDRSGEEGIESEAECPTLERSICQNNTVPVIVCTPERSAETAGDNQSDSTATLSSQTSPPAKHPGRVIVTNVTINSLTVTFLEATVAEGFFKGH